MITLFQAVGIIANRITKKTTHPWYERVVELAKLYRQLITGEEQEELLKQYYSNESDEDLRKIQAVTEPITSAVCNSLQEAFKKVLRTEPVTKKIDFDEFTEEKKKQVADAAGTYYGGASLEDFISNQFHDITFLDPNAFIVTEFKEFDYKQEKAKPYPYVVYSDTAVNYHRDNGVLEWLLVENGIMFADAEGKPTNGVKLYLYLKNHVIVVTERAIQSQLPQLLDGEEYGYIQATVEPEKGKKENLPVIIRTKEREFTVAYYTHNLGMVQAQQVGYVEDKTTNGQTYVSPIHYGAINYLKKTIKCAAEQDLSMHLHAFPQKFTYVDACTLDANQVCSKSGMRIDACTVCSKKGYTTPKSGKDITALKLPREPADIIDLQKLVHYVYPPIDGIKFQDEYIERLKMRCYKSVFNSEVFAKDEVAETATGKNIDLQNVYDTLYDYSVKVADFWKHTITLIAKLLDHKDCIPQLKYPKDFKLKSLTELLADLEQATSSNAPGFVRNELVKDIAAQLFVDRPLELVRFEMKQKLYPFSGKTPNEVMAGLNAGWVKKIDAVLCMYFDAILDQLEEESMVVVDNKLIDLLPTPELKSVYTKAKAENKLWLYDLPIKLVSALMYAKAAILLTEIEAEQPEPVAFGMPTD